MCRPGGRGQTVYFVAYFGGLVEGFVHRVYVRAQHKAQCVFCQFELPPSGGVLRCLWQERLFTKKSFISYATGILNCFCFWEYFMIRSLLVYTVLHSSVLDNDAVLLCGITSICRPSVTTQGRNIVSTLWFFIVVLPFAALWLKLWIKFGNERKHLFNRCSWTPRRPWCRLTWTPCAQTSYLAFFAPRLLYIFTWKTRSALSNVYHRNINNCTYDITVYVAFICDPSFELCSMNTLKP